MCFVGESVDVKELINDAVEQIANDATYENDEVIDYVDLPKGLIKRGVILPNNVQEWERTSEYFREHLHHNNKVKDVNKDIIYEYFSETHGQVKDKKLMNTKTGRKTN